MKKELFQERAEKMASLRREGKSLEQIGEEFSLTRERVRQILIQSFPTETFRHAKILQYKTFECKHCKKEKTVLLSIFKYSKLKFCSRKCYADYKIACRKATGIPTGSHFVSIAERRAYYSHAAKRWYERHKNDPAFKAVTSQRNKKQHVRRKLLATKK